MTLRSLLSVLVLSFALAGCTDIDASGADAKELGGSANEAAVATAAGTGAFLRSDKAAFEGTIAVGTQDPASGMTGCGDVGQQGVDQMSFDWVLADKESDGTASVVKKSVIKLQGTTPTTEDIDLFFIGPDGQEVSSGTSGAPSETLTIEKALKAGTYRLLVTACNHAAIQFTLDAQADYFAV